MNNSKRKHNAFWLNLTFVILFAVFLYLSITSISDGGISSLLINGGMFVIVFLIFRIASRRFNAIDLVISDLKQAAQILDVKGKNNNGYLWETLKNEDPKGVFTESAYLSEAYCSYVEERIRLETGPTQSYYICGIEDYINYGLIDNAISKQALNLVPGVMTGLGILGTFIGLTIGLQEFNTGGAAEIESSIAPLMNGIKVAFHTSMYGMVFSLVFNYLFRNQLDEAYDAIDTFISAFNRYVSPDSNNDNSSREHNAIITMPQAIADAMLPQFTAVLETLDVFTASVSKQQLNGFDELVKNFVSAMNDSLAGSFSSLAETIEATCELQKNSNTAMQEVLERLDSMTTDIGKIHSESERIIESMSSYVEEIEELQSITNSNMMSMNLQNEANAKSYEAAAKYLESLQNSQDTIDASFERISTAEKAISDATKQHIEKIESFNSSTMEEMKKASESMIEAAHMLDSELTKALENTFDVFDENLSTISTHLSGTISEIDSTSARVPKVVATAYSGMEKTFDDLHQKLSALVISLQDIIENLPQNIQ